jgi:hypothetical protein
VSTPETPRTCTLEGALFGVKLVAACAGDYKPAERVQFVEKAPVDVERERLLDLLESLMVGVSCSNPDCPECKAKEAARSLLREHGRLGKEES